VARCARRALLGMGHGGHHKHGHGHKMPAIVFDIDETTLSNYTAIEKDNVAFGTNSQSEAVDKIGTAIVPSRDLFNLAKQKGIAIFLITGRRENVRTPTAENLAEKALHGLQAADPAPGGGRRHDRRLQGRRAGEDRGSGLQDRGQRGRPVQRSGRRPHAGRLQVAEPLLLPSVIRIRDRDPAARFHPRPPASLPRSRRAHCCVGLSSRGMRD
jgi:putative acid phosphatase of HAD superfamily subfamily IIIB